MKDIKSRIWGQVSNQVRSQVRSQVRDQVWQVQDRVRGRIEQIRLSIKFWVLQKHYKKNWTSNLFRAIIVEMKYIYNQVCKKVWSQVWVEVRHEVRCHEVQVGWDQVKSQVGDQVWGQVGSQIWRYLRQIESQVRKP